MPRWQVFRWLAGFSIVLLLGSADAALAAVVMSGNPLPDTDASSTGSNNAKYKVTYANGSVDYTSTDVGRQQGTVKFTASFTTCDPIKFTFMQIALPMDDPAELPYPFGITDGLRLNIELMITNNTGQMWSGFWVKTDDQSVPMNLDPAPNISGGGNTHDHRAHFHPSPMSEGGPPMVTAMGVSGFTAPANAAINNATMFMIGGAQPDAGNGFNMTGFFLHERNLKAAGMPPTAVLRTFDVVLMPHCVVPELPSCLCWLVIMAGCIGLTAGRRRLNL